MKCLVPFVFWLRFIHHFVVVCPFLGTYDPEPCIAGHYCPLGTGLDPVPCPVNTYLDTTGAAVEADCKSCVKGYICNQTGLYYILFCAKTLTKNHSLRPLLKSNHLFKKDHV